MKVTFDKQELLAALTAAASVSQAKNTIASIEGLLFECPPNEKFGQYDGEDKSVCRISAFDLEKGLRMTVECSIFEEGTYIINTGKILQIVRALPDGQITLLIHGYARDERIRVTVEGSTSRVESVEEDIPVDYELTHSEALSLLFSPISPLREEGKHLAQVWFPLPLCMCHADGV